MPTTFATDEPLTVPISPLESTATFAGPPDAQPATAFARSMKNLPSPVDSKYAPNRMNRKMNVDETPNGMPKIPSVVKKMWLINSSRSSPRCAKMPGMYCPPNAYAMNIATTHTIGSPTTRRAASITNAIPIAPTITSVTVGSAARRINARYSSTMYAGAAAPSTANATSDGWIFERLQVFRIGYNKNDSASPNPKWIARCSHASSTPNTAVYN